MTAPTTEDELLAYTKDGFSFLKTADDLYVVVGDPEPFGLLARHWRGSSFLRPGNGTANYNPDDGLSLQSALALAAVIDQGTWA